MRAKFIVKGRVQGVFFRDETKKKADALNVKGYVKNLANGTLEVVADCDDKTMQDFLDWLWKGTSGAKVSEVIAKTAPDNEEYVEFSIRY